MMPGEFAPTRRDRDWVARMEWICYFSCELRVKTGHAKIEVA
jgi:hypothetical protein